MQYATFSVGRVCLCVVYKRMQITPPVTTIGGGGTRTVLAASAGRSRKRLHTYSHYGVVRCVTVVCGSCVSTHNHRWFITNRPIPQELYFQTFRRPRVYIWCRICHVWRWAINVSVGAVMPASRHLPSKGRWLGFDLLASHRKGWLCFWSSSGRSGARVGRGRSDLYVFLTSPLGLTRT